MDKSEQQHKNSLKAYLEQRPSLSMLWIVTVLKDCSVEEFDQHVSALEPTHSNYLRWVDIPKIRRKIVPASCQGSKEL